MNLTDQQVLVTGATGFLGGALARRLAADGAQVRGLARSARKAEALSGHGVEAVIGDVTDADSLRRAAEGCHVVFHCAAAFGSYPEQQAVNREGTRHVTQAAREAGVARFVHVSSAAVYGYNCGGDVTEATPASPGADPYAITKAEADQIVQESGVPYTMIRPGMIYGAGSPNWTGALFRLGKMKPTPFIGDGHGSCFPIHIDDVVDHLIIAAQHPAAEGQIFNCTPDPSPTWREFIGHYSRLAGHERWLALPVAPIAAIAWLVTLVSPRISQKRDARDALGFLQRQTTFKMDKARDLLGWTPHIDLESGIASCAPWLREQGLL
jgi:nucleoside-diphosphate-sugar epimerase